MGESKLNLITISYAKRVLDIGSREHERMCTYARSMHELHVIVFTSKEDKLPPLVQKENLHIYGTNARTKIGMVFQSILIGRKILQNTEKRYIVSSQDPFETSLVGRLIIYGKNARNHIQIHGDVFNPLSYKNSLLSRVRVVYGRWSVRHVQSIRVVSYRIKESLEALGVKSNIITVLPIQAPLEPFLLVGAERSYVPPKANSFLYVGRFSEEKNLVLLLNAFLCLSQKYLTCTLTLVGAGPMDEKIKDFIQQHNLHKKVIVKSWTEAVANEMGEHDVFCLSSNHEGWAMVLQEAAAAGMGIVTTDVGCAGEWIINNENGLVVSVGDTDAFALAMEKYIQDQTFLSAMQLNAHRSARQKVLTSEEYLQKLVDSYTS